MLQWILFFLFASPAVSQAASQAVSIVSLSFEGNDGIPESQLKAQVRVSREGGFYREDLLRRDLENLKRFYRNEGFLDVVFSPPDVEIRRFGEHGAAAAIRVKIVEGPRYSLGKIELEGVSRLDRATIMQMAPLRPGQPFGRKKIENWLALIRDSYHTMGYIRFDASIDERIDRPHRRVDCTITCREGNEYKVGRILIEGDDSVDPQQFKKRLLLGEDSPYNPEMLPTTLFYLNSMRIYRPIMESDVEVLIDDEKNTVDLVFHVTRLKKPSDRTLLAHKAAQAGPWPAGIPSDDFR